MQLQFRSSYQGTHEFMVIKHDNKSQIRLRHDEKSGVVHIDDYSKELSIQQRKELFRVFLNDQRKDRNKVRIRYKTLSNQVEKDIYKKVFLESIISTKRMFRANKSLH